MHLEDVIAEGLALNCQVPLARDGDELNVVMQVQQRVDAGECAR